MTLAVKAGHSQCNDCDRDLSAHPCQIGGSTLPMDYLGSKGVCNISLICVRVQKLFTDKNVVIKLPENVLVYESFLSLIPLLFLSSSGFRFVLGFDIDGSYKLCLNLSVLQILFGILMYLRSQCSGRSGSMAITRWMPLWRGFSSVLAANVESMAQGSLCRM
jgi:cellobiose-specific phosphotransferase system component IIC